MVIYNIYCLYFPYNYVVRSRKRPRKLLRNYGTRKALPKTPLKLPETAFKDIKYEYVHVCRLTNVYNSLVKPQEGKVLVLQLLQGPHWRAGVTVRAPRDGVRRQQEVEQRKHKTLSYHHYIQCHGRQQARMEIDDISLKLLRMMGCLMWWRTEQSVVNCKSIVVVQGS